ncbi:MAG: GSCFA domain-containing protein [Pseudomonadota bacterium]
MTILCLGHSHLQAMRTAPIKSLDDVATFVQLRQETERFPEWAIKIAQSDDCKAVCLVLHGNAHSSVGMINPVGDASKWLPNGVRASLDIRRLRDRMMKISRDHFDDMTRWIELAPGKPIFISMPPPPLPNEMVLATPGHFSRMLSQHGIAPQEDRVACWKIYREMLLDFAHAHEAELIDPPQQAIGAQGTLKPIYAQKDPTHGNSRYGALVISALFSRLGIEAVELDPAELKAKSAPKPRNPYRRLPPKHWWSRSVAAVAPEDIDPVGTPKFQIAPDDKVVTAGSCFAQHIGRRFQADGLNFHITEPVPEELRETSSVFSARYGNVYTAKQLLQLVERAYGRFQPVDDAWEEPDDRFRDPYRPTVTPDGFESREALAEARETHLAAVRRAVEEADVFVFTLGLTEAWVNRQDGAVYPIVPGASGGRYDPDFHVFRNFQIHEVTRDLTTALARIRDVNPGCRALITVSPVPLIATREKKHVLAATTYSKSVLRVAAEMVCRGNAQNDYFPSYEIITGAPTRGRYFLEDLREVAPEGVDHVMRVLYRHYVQAEQETVAEAPVEETPAPPMSRDAQIAEMERLGKAVCDEEALGRFDS